MRVSPKGSIFDKSIKSIVSANSKSDLMKIGVLGTGVVGQTIGAALLKMGHEVMMGSRSAGNEKAMGFVGRGGTGASQGTFAEAAAFGEVLFNCLRGEAALPVLESIPTPSLDGKILVDIANPLDFSRGMPPSLFVSNTDSLGERLQAAVPVLRVVKTLNIVNCEVMVNASRSAAADKGTMFISGNDAAAKRLVTEQFLSPWGWDDVIDLGDITTARGTEMLLPIWLRTYMATGNGHFSFKIVR